MSNKNPHKARKTKSQKRVRSGDLAALRNRHWRAISLATSILEDEDEPLELRLKAGHMVTQSVGAYTKLLESIEVGGRLKDLEKQFKDGGLLR